MQNLRCKIHPHQPITNFCTRQQCQVQLCATCICHHTDLHGDNGTLPHYQNIYQTYKRANDMVDTHRAQLESQRKKIIQFNENWERKKQNVYIQIQNAKKDVLELVERTFAQIKHKYIQAVHQEEIKIGMKSADKVLKMLQAHTIESDKLLTLQRELAGLRGPETAKLLFTIALPESISFMQKIGTDFSALNAYDLNLEYNQSQLIPLKQQINGLLALNINWPEQLVSVPVVEVVERRTGSIPKAPHTVYKTCSSGFYERPKSIGRPMKQVMVINGNSRLIIDNKPKVSVISGKMSQSCVGTTNPMLAKNLRRTMIFPVQQTRIIR